LKKIYKIKNNMILEIILGITPGLAIIVNSPDKWVISTPSVVIDADGYLMKLSQGKT